MSVESKKNEEDLGTLSLFISQSRANLAFVDEETSRNRDVYLNLGLVVSLAFKYVPLATALRTGMEVLDLIQEGSMGLIKAVDHFDSKKGFQFSTYADRCIRNEIKRAIKTKGKIVHIPEKVQDSLSEYKRWESEFVQREERFPTVDEIKKVCKTDLGFNEETTDLLVQSGGAEGGVLAPQLSLDIPLGDDLNNSTLGDVLINEGPDTFTQISRRPLKEDIAQAVNELPYERDKLVLGLKQEKVGMEDIAKTLGCSVVTVRTIYNKALGKLRESKNLRSWYYSNEEE